LSAIQPAAIAPPTPTGSSGSAQPNSQGQRRLTTDGPHDALVIGGGPAGLAGALYLARFCRDVLLIDAHDSRAARIPHSHNVAGFPDGIAGERLLAAMRGQVVEIGVPTRRGFVEHLSRDGELFMARAGSQAWLARTVLLATGALDVEPTLRDMDEALQQGVLRYCPVCDAYEARGRHVGVLCNSGRGAREALYLRHFTPHVALFVTAAQVAFSPGDVQRLRAAGIQVHLEPVRRLRLIGAGAEVTHGAHTTRVEALYSALGMEVRSGLAVSLGAEVDDDGYVVSDRHQQTTVDGLFVAGDVARGLNQISVAIGEAVIAASAMHLRL
jgi:thioredoxin reductase (NADPH)